MKDSLGTEQGQALPDPPDGRSGWPWDTPPAAPIPECMPDGRAWPKISIVTPNYNYGHYIEETIRSILLQGYPNLEYIVMDGGSTDGSLDVIGKYEKWITHWVSEKDRGQAHAINKGFARATGDLLLWINSDDVLFAGALRRFAEVYDAADEKLIFADVANFFPDGRREDMIQTGIRLENFIGIPEPEFTWHQPGMAVPRSFYQSVGGLDESLHYIFDWDWVCRLLIHDSTVTYLHTFVTKFRVHDASKTGVGLLECWIEAPGVVRRYNQHLPGIPARRIAAFYRLRAAALYFCEHPGSEHYWDRYMGIKSLLQAVGEDVCVILDAHFIRLLIRAALPRALYRSGSVDC
ncbi:MAG: glycosyltransferase family 2 protein [Mariprofundaceae bacterium]